MSHCPHSPAASAQGMLPLEKALAALLACARAGLGITLLPRSLVVTDLERGDLRELAVEDGGFHRSYFLVRHRSKYLTDGMKRVIRVLREHLGGEQP